MDKVEIIRVGDEANNWNAVEAFRTFEGSRTKRLAEEKEKLEAELDKIAAGFQKTESGLRYQYIHKGLVNRQPKEVRWQFTTKGNYQMVRCLMNRTNANNHWSLP